MTKVYTNGVHIGYACAGYMGWSNWRGPENGCNTQPLFPVDEMPGIGAAEAQAWLELLGTSTTETVILPDKNKRRKEERTVGNTSDMAAVVRVYPNPSNGPVFVVYEVPDGVGTVELLVHDAQGRLIRTTKGQSSGGILDIPENSMAPGVHVVSLYWDGILVGATKVEVIR